MALRFIEGRFPADAEEVYRSVLETHAPRENWREPGMEIESGEAGEERQLLRFKVVVEADEAEPLMDDLEEPFRHREGFRMLLLAVEAAVPLPEPEEEPVGPGADGTEGKSGAHRVSREELYEDLADGASLSPIYVIMIALSAVVCAFGLLNGDVAVIIGAMVPPPAGAPDQHLPRHHAGQRRPGAGSSAGHGRAPGGRL